MRKIDPKDPKTGAPQLSGTSLTVAEIVARTYEESVEAAAALASPALEPGEIRSAINFCADEACTAAAAYCPGCRKWTEREGIQSLDQFCARLASISFESGLELTPGGNLPPVSYPSLEALAQRWRGEEYWFLARRVIRRLKKMEAPRPKRLAGTDGMSLDPTLLLVRPQLADNIGMVARAMANFGLDDLRLIDPRDGWPNEKARAAASGANYIIDSTQAFRNLGEAIADLNYVCATTARQRDLAKPVLTPEQAVVEISNRLAKGERCGIVFGPERAGLETDEIAVADAVVMVPVNPRFASLNLAQAVLLVSYEWLKLTKQGTLGRVTTYETALEPGLRLRGSPPASKEELLGFFGHLERELERLGFFNPPHKRQTVMRNIQSMFGRMGATSQEVRTLRGIVATLSMGKGKGRKSPT
jgi:tRNA/rRNA methyltransferase